MGGHGRSKLALWRVVQIVVAVATIGGIILAVMPNIAELPITPGGLGAVWQRTKDRWHRTDRDGGRRGRSASVKVSGARVRFADGRRHVTASRT
jgi:hypothetical protein